MPEMKCSQSLANIAPALAKAQAASSVIGKSGHNTFDRYDYANLNDYVERVRPILGANGLLMIQSVRETIFADDRTTKSGGTEHVVRILLDTRIIHSSGEYVEVSCWGEGQDRADKAGYKAITGARKYGIACILGLATGDDPEAEERKPDAAAAKPGKMAQPPSPPAPPAAIAELKRLMVANAVTPETADAWLKKAGKKSIEALPANIVATLITHLKKKGIQNVQPTDSGYQGEDSSPEYAGEPEPQSV